MGKFIYRLEFLDELEAIHIIHPITTEIQSKEQHVKLFPATHYVVNQDKKGPLKISEQSFIYYK